MIAINQPSRPIRTNAWGQDCAVTRQRFRIESEDIGKQMPDYLGHGQPAYTFRASDVGRVIERMTDPGYHCFCFISNMEL